MLRPSRSGPVVAYAIRYAAAAHGHQVRKYSGAPYLDHPIAVYNTVMGVIEDIDMAIAAILHDVLEDTHVTYQDVRSRFGHRAATMVHELSDIAQVKLSTPPAKGSPYLHGSRRQRKRIETMRLLGISPEAQTIKMADLLDNAADIVTNDPDFAKVFMAEARAAFHALTRAHPVLRDEFARRYL